MLWVILMVMIADSVVVTSQKRITWGVVKEQISYTVAEVDFIMCLWKVETRSCVL